MADTVILVMSQGIGIGPVELQLRLAVKYFNLLGMQDPLPAAICFYTDGVKLLIEGSPVLDELRALEARGVRLIACSTCLDFFGLSDKRRVGIVGGMGDILEAQSLAAKVISI